MEYPRILTLIDHYLDRLTEARQVLLELDSASENGQKRRSQATANKRVLKAAAREKQARLAFDMTPSQPETPKAKSKANRRARLRTAQGSTESRAASSVQNELFPQEQRQGPLRTKKESSAKEGRPLRTLAPAAISVEVRAQRKPATRNKPANAGQRPELWEGRYPLPQSSSPPSGSVRSIYKKRPRRAQKKMLRARRPIRSQSRCSPSGGYKD